MKYHFETVERTLSLTQSSAKGLTSEQAAERLSGHGKNKLVEAKSKSVFRRFAEQLADPMIIILIAAAAISAISTVYEAKTAGKTAFPTDTLIIAAVVLINAVLGVFQESKAEKAIEALKEMSAATSRVLRNGTVQTVKSEDIVMGDIVLLEAGDAVPADCRIIESHSIKAEESALTGESVPVEKTAETLKAPSKLETVPLGDRKNMLYSGSAIVYGRGSAVVTATGMNTEMGKIADAISKAAEGQTPLQKKLSQLSKILTVLVLAICAVIFAVSLFEERAVIASGDGKLIFSSMMNMFMIAVSLAVAAVPEGLAAVVTIVLSIGVTNMSKKNAVIRKLTAVETLGCAQVICSDKTGTLTQNKMTVTDFFGDRELLAKATALCSDAQLNADGTVSGEPTEAALVAFAAKTGIDKNKISETEPRVREAPFDSGRKMMSTLHSVNGRIIQYTKGAPDVVIDKCTLALVDGKAVPMTDEIRKKAAAENKRMADKALRVLAAAAKEYADIPEDTSPDSLETGLTFIGLIGMMDPVRPEVKAAIDECREAGIIPVMITGDHKDTAVAIAEELGIITDPSEAMTGTEISSLSDSEFEKRVESTRVYARVQPEHKTRIVNAWRKKGKVTAMTGDGVNDAPSIKSADIGIGMGITGTDVTKNVADMVLADDNFATIVGAVGEGRRIYDNIRKAIQFLLGSNLAEVLTIFVSTLLGVVVLKAPHLLFINLVTDCFPALALGCEKAEKNIMRRPPRKSSDGIFSGGLGFDIAYQGIVVTVLTLAAFFIGEWFETGKWIFTNIADCEQGMTMAFLTMSMCEIFHSFNMRSQRGSVIAMSMGGSHNKFLFGAMAASLVLTTAVIEVPVLSSAFGFTPIGVAEYASSLALAFSVIPIVEAVKAVQRKRGKNGVK